MFIESNQFALPVAMQSVGDAVPLLIVGHNNPRIAKYVDYRSSMYGEMGRLFYLPESGVRG